jgi:hypothetical protein
MGLTFSAPLEENSVPSNEIQNIKNFANVEDNNILDTLNISELNTQAKSQMPLIGGFNIDNDSAYNFSQQVSQRKERYNDYDLFNIMTNLEAKNNIVGGNVEDEVATQTSSTNHGMDAIKSIIMDEINNYKQNKQNNESDNIYGGGDCGCSGDNKILEGGKKKKGKKSKKSITSVQEKSVRSCSS